MPIKEETFGALPEGTPVTKFVLSNLNDIRVEVMNYGGTLVAVYLPDSRGNRTNVCLGFDTLEGYLSDQPYLGCIVGRVANRIQGGQFTLEGISYTLAKNENNANHLHGGVRGFDKKVWDAEPFETEDVCGVTLKYESEDGEEGYPGNLDVTIVYSLNEENELTLNYKAETDAPTPVNLTNHAYWNFAGAGSGTILDHVLKLNAAKYLVTDEANIPTGAINMVNGTPLDFQKAKRIGADINQVGGYDHCFVINDEEDDELVKAAEVFDSNSGRGMRIVTTKPGVQLYTGNYLNGIQGANGAIYDKHHGLCLETQYFPDSVNKSQFPSTILHPGDTYHHITIHKFLVE